MRNLALMGGVVTRAMAAKVLSDADAKLNFVASEKPHVIIAWQGTPLDGHAGTLEGTNGQGKSLVRLDATGGVFAVPGEFLTAAPKAKEKKDAGAEARKPNPGSLGKAPQEEELTKKAKDNVEKIVEPPKSLEKMKEGPRDISKDKARTAPEAGSPIQALVDKTLSIETEKANAIQKLNKFKEGLNLELIDENYKKTVKELHDAIEATGEPVLKLKDQLLATVVKRDVTEANMSDETRKKFDALIAKLEVKETEMAKLNEQIEELVNASFARMGGTEKQTQRVVTYPSGQTAAASLIETVFAAGLTEEQNTRFQRLQAGLKEMFKAIVDKAKEFASGIGELLGLGEDFISSYERDAKAADKSAEAAPAPAPVAAQKLSAQRAFDVFLDGVEIDTVFYSEGAQVDEAEVKHSLINHDGYDPGITVKEHKKKPKTGKDA